MRFGYLLFISLLFSSLSFAAPVPESLYGCELMADADAHGIPLPPLQGQMMAMWLREKDMSIDVTSDHKSLIIEKKDLASERKVVEFEEAITKVHAVRIAKKDGETSLVLFIESKTKLNVYEITHEVKVTGQTVEREGTLVLAASHTLNPTERDGFSIPVAIAQKDNELFAYAIELSDKVELPGVQRIAKNVGHLQAGEKFLGAHFLSNQIGGPIFTVVTDRALATFSIRLGHKGSVDKIHLSQVSRKMIAAPNGSFRYKIFPRELGVSLMIFIDKELNVAENLRTGVYDLLHRIYEITNDGAIKTAN